MGKIKPEPREIATREQNESWDYDESVEIVKAETPKFNRSRDKILNQVILAYKNLKNQGRRTDLELPANGRKLIHTFEEWCMDTELPLRTAYRWLKQYDEAEQRLLSEDEYVRRKKIEAAEQERERKYMIEQYEETGVKPDGWDKKTEKEYQYYLLGKEVAGKTEIERRQELPKIAQDIKRRDIETDQLIFAECRERNLDLIIRKRSIPVSEQIFFFYQIEEYINSALPHHRQDFLQQLAGKLQMINEEIKK